MIFEDELIKRKRTLEKYYVKINQDVKVEPSGRIKTTKVKNGEYEFFYSDYGSKSKVIYIHKDDTKRISALLQKRYNHKALRIIEKQILAIKDFEKKYKSSALADVYSSFNEDFRKYVEFLEWPDEEYARRWQEKKYEGNPYPFSSTAYITKKGETVRSKSELLIANALNDAGVPYRYEYPLTTAKGYCMYPDFLILDVKNRTEIIWEHFGKMDDSEYREKALKKLEQYSKVGRTAGKDFIVTFEDYKNPLSTNIINSYINSILS